MIHLNVIIIILIQWVGGFGELSPFKMGSAPKLWQLFTIKKNLCHNISHMTDGVTGTDKALDMMQHISIKGTKSSSNQSPARSFSNTRQGNKPGFSTIALDFRQSDAISFQIHIISYSIILGLERDTVPKSRLKWWSANGDGKTFISWGCHSAESIPPGMEIGKDLCPVTTWALSLHLLNTHIWLKNLPWECLGVVGEKPHSISCLTLETFSDI